MILKVAGTMEEPKAAIRVLLADPDDNFRRITASALERCSWIDLVASVQDGEQALRLTMEKLPDIVVLDTLLTEYDGLTIASMLRKEQPRIDVMLMTVFTSRQFWRNCAYLNIAEILKKPLQTATILERLQLWGNSRAAEQKQHREKLWQNSLSKLMHAFGIPQGTKGYLYVDGAILYELTHKGAASNITKQIYPELAAKYGNKPLNVERAIRNAIENIVKNGNRALLEEYFGPVSSWKKGHPTNAAFIARAAELLRQGEIEEDFQTK